MSFLFIESGSSARALNFRKMFDNVVDLERDLNKYKTFSNIYHSIYWFRETEKKLNRIGPNYETALINRVVLDMDAFEKTRIRKGNKEFESYTPRALDDMRKLEEWAEEKDLIRKYRLSGGGFYFIFSARGHPLKLRDFEINLQNELNIRIDISTIGDTSRMMRATNSFNFKEHRNCYCIPIKREELYWKFEDIKRLAEKPRFEEFVYGNNIHDFSNCKIDKEKIKLKRLKFTLTNGEKYDANKILLNYGWELDDFCPTIKGILSLGHVGNALRFEVLKYLKTIVKVKYEDAVKILASILKEEGYHSAVEGQARYVYAKDKQFNPDWKLKQLGYCDPNCDYCKKMKNIVLNVLKNAV